jgi:hypothetical protein
VSLAIALVIVTTTLFLSLAQQNRFYTLAILLLLGSQAMILTTRSKPEILLSAGAIGLALLAVLCHGVLVVYFMLTGATAVLGYFRGWVPRIVLFRSLAVAVAIVCLYFLHVRPLVAGWNEFLPHRTMLEVSLSFLSEVGLPTLGLAFLGGRSFLARRAYGHTDTGRRWHALPSCSF